MASYDLRGGSGQQKGWAVEGRPGSELEKPGEGSGGPGGLTAGGGVIVEVREKKGPLRAAIPTMPFPLALICLFLNTFIPGLGTLIAGFSVLCGTRSELLAERGVCCVFWLNVVAALIQIGTAVVIVGWIMSIFWGMDMVILSRCRNQGVPQQV